MRFKVSMSELLIDERMSRARINKGFNGSRDYVNKFGRGEVNIKGVRI